MLDSGTCDVDKWNTEGLAPIHAIVLRKHRDKADILLALLTNSEADVNLQSMQGNTALHLAVTVCCIPVHIIHSHVLLP